MVGCDYISLNLDASKKQYLRRLAANGFCYLMCDKYEKFHKA